MLRGRRGDLSKSMGCRAVDSRSRPQSLAELLSDTAWGRWGWGSKHGADNLFSSLYQTPPSQMVKLKQKKPPKQTNKQKTNEESLTFAGGKSPQLELG